MAPSQKHSTVRKEEETPLGNLAESIQ